MKITKMFLNPKLIFLFLLAALILNLINSQSLYAQSWSGFPGGGMNDWVYSSTIYNGDLIVGGKFTGADGVNANHIARWDGTTWSALGDGVNGKVNALVVYKGNLIAGGEFFEAGGLLVNYIALWNGSSWSDELGGVGSIVTSLAVIGDDLYVGGYFTEADNLPVNYIAKRNSNGWSALGSGTVGTEGQVMALSVFNGELYAGGFFTNAGGVSANHIAKWDGISWSSLGSGISNIVYTLGEYKGNLIAGGLFMSAGGKPANHIASWNGTDWSALGGGMGGIFYQYVFALQEYNGELIAGGYFTTSDGLTTNGIAKWNGSSWSDMNGGLFYPGNVYGAHTLCLYGADLIVGGLFNSPSSHIAIWNSPAPVPAQQSITVPQGWSGLSGYVLPDNPAIESLFLPVQNQLTILQNLQGFYYPSQQINTLGNWDSQSGYVAKFNQATTIDFSGVLMQNGTLNLEAGWNLIPVLSTCPVIAETFFAGYDVGLVKEVAGSDLYWPAMGINSLGLLLPGKAYYVLMNSPATIGFPDCSGSTWQCGNPFVDSRDNQIYNTVQIGTQCWMSENLNIGNQIAGTQEMTNNTITEKYCYDNNPANCNTYGGLYQWKELMQYSTTPGTKGICADGWHVPTDDEWCTLEQTVDPTITCGTTGLRGTDGGINLQQGGTSGFEALVAGYRSPSGGLFNSFGSGAYLWSSNAVDFSTAWSRSLNAGGGEVLRTNDNHLNGFSVRCIKENCTTAPAEPTSGTHVPSMTQIIWNWNAVPEAAGYFWNTTNDLTTALDLGAITSKTETGLTCNTVYNRFVWAYNACGNSTPLTISQTTFSCGGLPTITTTPVSYIGPVTATSGGNVTSSGGTNVTARGVCWSTSPNPTIADGKTTNGTGTGIFVSEVTGLETNTDYFLRAYATNGAGTAYGNVVAFTTTQFEIGQSYGGGKIFYIDGTGQHGLIAATTDQSTSTQWGCSGTLVGTSTAFGTGQTNTTAIVNACTQAGTAARICNDLVLNGYNDWFLPSKDELYLMYQRQEDIGAFAINTYWSSSEQGATFAWYKFFDDNNQSYSSKTWGYYVRAIRAF